MGRRAKKLVITAAAVFVGLIVIIALLVNVFGDRALKAGIETAAGNTLQVPVRMDDISLAILAGKVNLTNLVIDNPPGYQNPTFLELGHAFMALNTRTLLSDPIVIDRMHFNDLSLTIEQRGITNNLSEILGNLPEREPQEETAGRDLHIRELELRNIRVNVKLLPLPGRADTLSFELAPIRMTDIGTDQPVDAAVLTKEIVLAIAGGIAEQGKGLLPSDMLRSVTDEFLKSGQGALKGLEDIGKGLFEGGKGAGENAVEGLRNLFPGKKE